jgi:transcriptional regulator with XRE-family HTH domain
MNVSGVCKLRRRLGLSQQELARRLGVARATVTHWENGRRYPSKIAELAIQSIVETKDSRAWQRLTAAALNALWDNLEDAVYDGWQDVYHPGWRPSIRISP